MTKSKSRRGPKTVLLTKRAESCAECESPLRWKTSTSAKPHALADYGFSLKVTGLPVATCRCGTTHAVVGNAARFREGIAEQILRKPGALVADEIVFLRKQLRLTGGQFAALVGVSREHVSHIEQGHAPSLGTTADRLVRLVFAAKFDPTLKMMKRVLASLDEEIGTRSMRRPVRHSGYRVSMTKRA